MTAEAEVRSKDRVVVKWTGYVDPGIMPGSDQTRGAYSLPESAAVAVVIDYYLAPVSPFSYLGGDRLTKLVRDTGVEVNTYPIDMTKVFPATGGLPLKQRAPERQAYRLAELRRWRDFLDIPLVPEPRYFPADATPASLMIIAAREQSLDALGLSQRILRACWAEERDIADRATLVALADEFGVNGEALMQHSTAAQITQRFESETQAAIGRGVFGVPTYAVGDELFWGQDRLEFVERKINQVSASIR